MFGMRRMRSPTVISSVSLEMATRVEVPTWRRLAIRFLVYASVPGYGISAHWHRLHLRDTNT